MTPLHVSFMLRTPMVLSDDKTLDALLSWAAVQQAEYMGSDDPIAAQHDTGLAQHEHEGVSCPMASRLKIQFLGPVMPIHYTKAQKAPVYAHAFDRGLLAKKAYFDGARGLTKAGLYFQRLRYVERIDAWCVAQSEDRVRELLPWITHIGKLHRYDWGAVRRFECVEDAAANELWADRNLPLGSPFGQHHALGIGALRAPYYDRASHREILIPL